MEITCLINRGPLSYVLTVSGDHKLEDLNAAMEAYSSLQFVYRDAILQSSFWNGAFDEGEDEKSIEAHIETMKKEMHLAGGNADKIRESMHKTFQRRRAYIKMKKPALTDLRHIYPALSLERKLLNEFHRLTDYYTVSVLKSLPCLAMEDPTAIIAQLVHKKRAAELHLDALMKEFVSRTASSDLRPPLTTSPAQHPLVMLAMKLVKLR
ncbi:hypothetical protein HPB49_011124 [Dermacentor silvarum]|uniref:Uncharacterized protein n=1 Tax=Dermacentor silvarum TaxID=543639 RepID=A0ACB8CEU4_DERSI|nr:hypothetical protein HPB49_011124 [Dermacentor silvarum]